MSAPTPLLDPTTRDHEPTTPFDLLDHFIASSAARLTDVEAACQLSQLDPFAVETALIRASIEGAQVLLDRVRLYARATRIRFTNAICTVLNRFDEFAWQIDAQIRALESQRQIEQLTVAQRQQLLSRTRTAHRRLLNIQGQMALVLAHIEQDERQEIMPDQIMPVTTCNPQPTITGQKFAPAIPGPQEPAFKAGPLTPGIHEPAPGGPATVVEAMSQLTDLLDNVTTILEEARYPASSRPASSTPSPLSTSRAMASRSTRSHKKGSSKKAGRRKGHH